VDHFLLVVDYYGYFAFKNSDSFWSRFYEAIKNTFEGNLSSPAAQAIAVLLISCARFIAIVKPLMYKRMMIPKRIFSCCLLSYILLIPLYYRIWNAHICIHFSLALTYWTLPPIISLILNVITFRALTKHLIASHNGAAKNELRDSRSIIVANLIETIVQVVIWFPATLVSFTMYFRPQLISIYFGRNWPIIAAIVVSLTELKFNYSPAIFGFLTSNFRPS
jgi:hypothetical protein